MSMLNFVRRDINDIIDFNRNRKEHQRDMELHGLKLHQEKCRFYHDKIKYLGLMILLGGLSVMYNKVASDSFYARIA
jgi:hypothetical protein